MKARSMLISVGAAAAVGFTAACTIMAGPPIAAPVGYAPPPQPVRPYYPPAGPAPGGRADTIVDERGRSIMMEHGPPGDPAVIGCADGRREAFLDERRYPRIAGCLGIWGGRQSLRSAPTGQACGDEGGPCATPADLCASGWHICGSNGAVADLRQVSAEECEQAGGGRFAAGISHCKEQHGCAVDPTPDASYACYPHGWCSEPVCCGRDCGQFGMCRDGVWPQHTHIPSGQDQGCGSTESRRAGGVLCCQS